MICLNDSQLQIVMATAADLPKEKRSLFLQRLSSMINIRGRRFSDLDLDEMVKLACTGSTHQPAA